MHAASCDGVDTVRDLGFKSPRAYHFYQQLSLIFEWGLASLRQDFSRGRTFNPRTTVAARLNENASPSDDAGTLETLITQPPIPRWDIAARVVRHRAEFIRYYPDAASSIDLNVQLTSRADLIRYLPRAAVIGFFAPFPDMWFVRGGPAGATSDLWEGYSVAWRLSLCMW
jgi:hypothetical protein